MWRFAPSRRRFPPRHAVAAVLFLGQLVATFGFPIAVKSTQMADSSQSYPCSGHACACVNADKCWEGACCCFTLEEKLAWADANHVAVPGHVRPLVESRKAQVVAKNKPKCCRDREQTACSECEKPIERECPSCAAEKVAEPREVQWILVFRSQKCRGEGPMGLFSLPPTIVSRLPLAWKPDAPIAGRIANNAMTPISIFTIPPTRPPRIS
jgi:hypothetical protein